MPINITFLAASLPLVKRFELIDGVLVKHSYPNVTNLTSIEFTINNIQELFYLLKEQATAPNKPCLFKGELLTPLHNESRRNMGKTDALTQYAVLDFDNAPFASHEEAMRALNITDVSYVWQHSSSAKLNPNKTSLSGHAFVVLSKAIHPHVLKAWFIHCNLHIDVLKNALTLSSAKQALHYPLDVVVSDNNRIIYIGDPVFIGIEDPMASEERIQFIKRRIDTLNTERIPEYSIEALKEEVRETTKKLRIAEGLPNLKSKMKQVGEWEIQAGVGAATKYQVIDDGSSEFIRYNLNGGDSQAYWHPRHQFELLHSFKGEPSMYMKEILPQRYAEMCRLQADVNAAPSENGDLLLAYREKTTGRYWKGVWNPEQYKLDIHPVGAIIDLEHFLLQHGRTLGQFVPEWHMIYDPRQKFVVNADTHQINMFVPPPLMRGRENIHARKTTYPVIQRILDSAVGTGLIQEHFLNWLAVIVQHRRKTMSSWILHGTQGTGKDLLINSILRPIFTSQYLQPIRTDEVNGQFNGWLEKNLIVFVNEIDVEQFISTTAVASRLKQSITDSFMAVRKMRTDAQNPENFVNLIFGSNMPQPVMIPLDDRRFNVGQFQTQRFITTSDEIENILPTEIEAFAYYLNSREANIDRAKEVLQTEDRAAIQALGVSSIDEFAHDIIKGNLSKLFEYMPDERMMNEHGLINPQASAYAAMMKRFYVEDSSKISRDELHLMFSYAIGDIKQGPNKFTTFLRHRGITTKKLWYNGESVYGIEVKWTDKPEYKAPQPIKLKKVG